MKARTNVKAGLDGINRLVIVTQQKTQTTHQNDA